ncbi:MAG: DUF1631 domain-containing protein [Xanthomonadales bacterium]|nr:DUF1631 domain-containing protein [Xanthomonadales bacterium]
MDPATLATEHTGARGFPTLAARTDLPRRVGALLGGLLAELHRHFEGALARSLDELENSLFARAERAPDNAHQQRHFEALREVKRARAQIAPGFFAYLQGNLARTRTLDENAGPQPISAGEPAPLRLVDSAVLDETLALRDIAGRAEIRHSEALYLLGHRMAVIGATPVPSAEELPFGPAQLVAAFSHGMSPLELAPDARLTALRQFEQTAFASLDRFYGALNTWLEQQRILPNLDFQANLRRQSTPHAPAASGAARTDAASATPASAATLPPPLPSFSAPPPPQPPPLRASTAADAPAVMFDDLRELLGERRRLEGEDAATADTAGSVSGDDLQAALDALQRRAPAGSAIRQDSEYLKNSLLVRLRRSGAPGQPVRLGGEHADTIDLVGMLFDHIATNLRGGNQARALLTRLQVPVLRVALEDKSFFTRRDHPARELLNAVAETSTRWIDEEADPALLSKLQGIVERVTDDFDGNVDVFAELLADLNRHLQTLARRAELAERRHIEAARGRDKLEVACETARAAIRRVLDASTPDPVARVLLERAWTDALALSALRHGAGSEEFRRRVEVAGQLASDRGASAQDLGARQVLERGLREVGLHEDDLDGVFSGLAAPPAQAAEASSRLGETLESRQRLGGTPAATATGTPERMPLSDAEAYQLAQLRRVPFGTWFEFTANQQGERVRRKLAWYSPVSGRCLFLNQRGVHGGDRTLDQLAREMVRGHARIAPPEPGSLIDRAWTAITAALRRHVAPAPAVGAIPT